jgi:hypothetical protein
VTAWTRDELDRIGGSDDLELSVGERTVTIWVVRVGDDLYVRSWRGANGAWYRSAQQAPVIRIRADSVDREVALVAPDDDLNGPVDDAYRTKYHRYLDSYTAHMVAPQARATTRVLEPR